MTGSPHCVGGETPGGGGPAYLPTSANTLPLPRESADAHLAYAQARAMVELIRECGGFGAIGQARKDFDTGHDSTQVLARACQKPEVTGEDLLEFLSRRLKK